jgi:hypothetical protein
LTLDDAQASYQVLLEGVRAHPEDEELRADLETARCELEVAWFRHKLEEL